MRKPFSFYLAVLMTRFTIFILRLFGFAGTHVPGHVALAICPLFLEHIGKPKDLIMITGTNGKTTVSNLITDFYQSQNIAAVNNSTGSNIEEGIIVAMLAGSTFFGKNKVATMVLEVDERASYRIFPYLIPDVLVITNLFRDSYKRNAHPEFISGILEDYIPETTTLVVNGDDLISSLLKPNNKKLVFGIVPLKQEISDTQSLIHDMKHCPVCHYPLTYQFVRHHHIGQAKCSVCGFKNLKADLQVTRVSENLKQAYGTYKNQRFELDLHEFSTIDIYNKLSVIGALLEMGFEFETIIKTINTLNIVETRYQHIHVNNKDIILMLAKDQNLIAVSRVFEQVTHDHHDNIGILLINENHDNHREIENMAWYYDTDFERLNHPNVKQIVEGGYRYHDFIVRAKMANIDASVIDGAADEFKAAELVDFERVDRVYVLYGTKNIKEANQVKTRLIQKASEVEA